MAPPSPRRVLVVDDDEAALELLRQFLERAGMFVTTASDSASALDIARREPFDVYLIDKNLPEEGAGIDTIRQILEVDPGALVLLMTAYGSADSAYEAVRAGASGYLLKPFRSAPEIVRAVNDAVARSESRHRAVQGLRAARSTTGRMRTVTPATAPSVLAQISLRVLSMSADPVIHARVRAAVELGKWKMHEVSTYAEAEEALKEVRFEAVVADGSLGDQALRALDRARNAYPDIGIVFAGSSLTFVESRELVALGSLVQTPKLPEDAQQVGELIVRSCARVRAARRGAR